MIVGILIGLGLTALVLIAVLASSKTGRLGALTWMVIAASAVVLCIEGVGLKSAVSAKHAALSDIDTLHAAAGSVFSDYGDVVDGVSTRVRGNVAEKSGKAVKSSIIWLVITTLAASFLAVGANRVEGGGASQKRGRHASSGRNGSYRPRRRD